MDPKLGCFGPLLDPYLEGTARPRQALFGPGVRHWTKAVNIPNPGIRGIWGVLGRYPWGSHLDPKMDPFLDPFWSPIRSVHRPLGSTAPWIHRYPILGSPEDPIWGPIFGPKIGHIWTTRNRAQTRLGLILSVFGPFGPQKGPQNGPKMDPFGPHLEGSRPHGLGRATVIPCPRTQGAVA